MVLEYVKMDNYSKRHDAFMTFSIYFANFFKKNDVKELMVSMETQMLTAELTEIPGAPGCTIFKTKSKGNA